MMKRIFRLCCLAFSSTLLLTGNHAAARSLSEIRETKSIIVGANGGIAPFQFKVSPTASINTIHGFEVDILKAIASDLGVELVFKEYPTLAELNKAVTSDQVDAGINTIAITSTRDKSFDLTAPYACLAASILTTDPAIKTQFDLKGKKVGLVKNSIFVSYAQKLPFDKQLILFDTPEQQITNFLGKQYDATISWKAQIPFMAKVYNVPLQETPTLWSIPVGAMLKPGNDSLRLAMNNSIYKMQRDGRLNALNQQYFPKDSVVCGR